MQVIHARNVHQALPEACHQLSGVGVKRESRDGPVLMFPTPITTVYKYPRERVIFWPERDANPFFHFFEALWMLAGRDDVVFVAHFASHMSTFSDDGKRFNSAYGHRWRRHFDRDQLPIIAKALAANPDCRRQVLGIWDARHDLALQSKDLPCNTQVYFQRNVEGALDMMVTNRSNDLIWGAYGANAVHFSVLHEYMASLIGCEMGTYYQTSMNTHVYLNRHQALLDTMAGHAVMPPSRNPCPYESGEVMPAPLMGLPPGRWDRELSAFMVNPSVTFNDQFFELVAKPLFTSWTCYKVEGDPMRFAAAKNALMMCGAADWSRACWEWIDRRERKWKSKS